MKHIHLIISEDASEEQIMLRLRNELLPVIILSDPRSAVYDPSERIRIILLSLGMPAHLKGYHYLNEGIRLAVDDPRLLDRLTIDLYPAIARRFGTTASKVERAIRHAIDITWQRGRVEQINQLLGCRAACQEDKPTNGELIATIAEQIWQEQNKK